MRANNRAKSAGLVAALVGVVVTLFVALLVPPPWSLGTVLLGVGVATYATGYAVAALA